MKNIVLFASIFIASGIVVTNIYTSLVDATSWGSDIPRSVEAARTYFKTVNPGDFFRVFSPLNQVLALLALILFWKSAPTARLYLGIALIAYVLCDVMTFAYFYPRNDLMFKDLPLTDVDGLRKAWSEWNSMNWVRSLIGFLGVVCSFWALHKIYRPNGL